MGTLKIDTGTDTGSEGLSLTSTNGTSLGGTNATSVPGGILYTGSANFTISPGNPSGGTGFYSSDNNRGYVIQQYGTGTLTISTPFLQGYNTTLGSATPPTGAPGSYAIVSSGSYTLTKGGTGTLILSGANNYNGTTYINEGTLEISSDSNLGGISGTVTIATGATSATQTVTADPSVSLANATFDGTTVSAVNGTTLTLSASETTTTGQVISYAEAGEINLAGTLEANGTFSLSETNGSVTANRQIDVMSDGGTIDVTAGNTLTVPGVIVGSGTGTGTLTKTDSGTLVLSGANTYLGATAINGGVLQVASTEVAGTSSGTGSGAMGNGGLVIFGGGTLQYTATDHTTDFSSRIQDSTGAISVDTNGQTVSYGTSLVGTNTGGLTESDTNGTPGILKLIAANGYSGATTVNSGTLQVSGTGNLGNTTNALAVNGGTLDLDGTSQTVGLFGNGNTGAGTILNSGSGTASTLTVGNGTTTGQTGIYGGVIEDHASGTGTVAVNVTGLGTTTLSGANTYSGATTVNSGTLNVTGSIANSATTVNNGATVTGTGSVAALTLASGGTITPGLAGSSTGNLTATGGLTWTAGGSLTFALSSTSNASGLLTLNLGTLTQSGAGVFNLNLTGGVVGDTYELVEYGNTTFTAASEFTSTGDVGTFAFTSLGGGESALEFTASAVPEPTTWTLLLGGLALLAFHQYRLRARRQSAVI